MNKKPLGATGPFSTLNGSKKHPHPEAGMIFSTSLPRFKTFLGNFSGKASDVSCSLLFLSSFLLPCMRRSVTAASHSVLSDVREASWLLRWLGGSKAPAALLAVAQFQLQTLAGDNDKRLHVLAIDSTCHSQQGTCTQNTYSTGNTKKRPAKSSRKQKKVHRKSSHCFVFAVLLCPNGLRIPYFLPFYTKEYCRIFGRKHLSQADLAAQLIDGIPVAKGIPVVVVGDTAFEAKQIRSACARRDWQWVMPLNPERCLAGDKPRPKVRTLYDQLQATDFRKVSFRLDQGDLSALARVSSTRSKAKKHERTYWVHHRIAAVHNVGEVALLFSTQTQPATSGGVKVQKVLISNAVKASTEVLLQWYSLRWQIELFFKECKSELGMCQYKLATGPFQRVVGWVDLAVVAFCYLEWYRYHKHQEAVGMDKSFWQRLRCAALKEKVRQEVFRGDIEALLRLAAAGDARQLSILLERICDDPSGAAA
jgi:Transposase DDE domain